MASLRPPPIAFRLRRPYTSEEEFIAEDGCVVSRSGMILIGAGSRPTGLIIRFEVALEDGRPLLRGEGKVVVHRSQMEGEKPPGLEVRFLRLDTSGKALINRILQEREASQGMDIQDVPIPSIPPLSMELEEAIPSIPHHPLPGIEQGQVTPSTMLVAPSLAPALMASSQQDRALLLDRLRQRGSLLRLSSPVSDRAERLAQLRHRHPSTTQRL